MAIIRGLEKCSDELDLSFYIQSRHLAVIPLVSISCSKYVNNACIN